MHYICCCGGRGLKLQIDLFRNKFIKQFPINGLKFFQQDFIYKQHLTMAHFDFTIVLNYASFNCLRFVNHLSCYYWTLSSGGVDPHLATRLGWCGELHLLPPPLLLPLLPDDLGLHPCQRRGWISLWTRLWDARGHCVCGDRLGVCLPGVPDACWSRGSDGVWSSRLEAGDNSECFERDNTAIHIQTLNYQTWRQTSIGILKIRDLIPKS